MNCGQKIREHGYMPSEEILTSEMPRRGRGRPRGSGWRQKLACVGENRQDVNMGSGLSHVSVPVRSSEELTTSGMLRTGRGRGRPPGTGWRQKLARDRVKRKELAQAASQNTLMPDEVTDCNELQDHVNMGLGVSLVSVAMPSPGEEVTSSGREIIYMDRVNLGLESSLITATTSQVYGDEITPGGMPHRCTHHLLAPQNMSFKAFQQVISTSNKQLSDSLKEIMYVNKKLIEVDAKHFHILETEIESVEDVLEHNHNVLLDLKTEICSLEKCQAELLSQAQTKISDIKNKSKSLILEDMIQET